MKLYFRLYHKPPQIINNQQIDTFFADAVNFVISTILNQIEVSKSSGTIIEEIILEIQSFGGSSDHGLKIYNFLKSLEIPVTTIANTNVDSAAVMLFCAGDKRLVIKPTRFLIHQARSSGALNNFGTEQILEHHNILKSLNDSYISILNKIIKISESDDDNFNTLYQRVYSSHIFNQDEALKNGLVTEIIESKYIVDDADVQYLNFI